MHGPAVASLLVGTKCGTAPDARVYYVAAPSWKMDTAYEAKALDWIIEQNARLPASQKIRVVSNSGAPSGPGSPYDKNRETWDQACARAEADGIMVLDCTSHRGFISRCWYDAKDPESVGKCNPGGPKGGLRVDPTDIHVPASCRTTAQHYDYHGRNSYIYWGRGGLSWSIPYCAGVLAMGWQVRPDLTPEQMKEMLFASAYVHKSGARIINPTAFIDLVRNQSGNQQIRTRPRTYSETQTIVPGVGIGAYTLDMSKDGVLKELGEPETIQLGFDDVNVVRRGEERYSLNNLPSHYILSFGNISFWFSDDSIEAISVHSPLYKLSNGLGVGDPEQKIKQAFGEDFHLREVLGKDFLCYDSKGLGFEIHKKKQTVAEVLVYEDSSVKPIESIKRFDDVRSKDLSKLDLSSSKGLIATLAFNQQTVWPEQAKMPPGSDPQKILADAMNPGIGVRKLHQQGITGKGVNVAIIDQPLFLDHPGYDGKIVAYHDTGCGTSGSSMHGPAVASLLVGTKCGTAPDARVYYAAAPSWKRDAAYYAKGLDWIIEQNDVKSGPLRAWK